MFTSLFFFEENVHILMLYVFLGAVVRRNLFMYLFYIIANTGAINMYKF